MEKFQSLADFLGTSPTFPDGTEVGCREPEPPRLEDISDSKTFALAILNSREFRRYLVAGVTLGDLPTPIILRLMDHAWGKPVERVEVKDTSVRLEDVTPEQLEQRALKLAEMARFIRLEPLVDEGKSIH